MFDKDSLKVYFICGPQDIPSSKSIKEVVKIALDSGITMFQYREKGDGALIGNDKREMAQQLLELCQSYNVPFIVNDDVALAENINADGIHVGQNDMKVTEFAQKFKNKIIGLSISDVNEYQQSDLTCVDYIGVGPMYATNSKKDANLPVGPEMIPKLRSYIEDFPLVAIGGITVDNTKEIIQAGADGVSIISAISKSANVSKTVRQFLQNVD